MCFALDLASSEYKDQTFETSVEFETWTTKAEAEAEAESEAEARMLTSMI